MARPSLPLHADGLGHQEFPTPLQGDGPGHGEAPRAGTLPPSRKIFSYSKKESYCGAQVEPERPNRFVPAEICSVVSQRADPDRWPGPLQETVIGREVCDICGPCGGQEGTQFDTDSRRRFPGGNSPGRALKIDLAHDGVMARAIKNPAKLTVARATGRN